MRVIKKGEDGKSWTTLAEDLYDNANSTNCVPRSDGANRVQPSIISLARTQGHEKEAWVYVRVRPATQYQVKVRTSANSRLGHDSSWKSHGVHARVHICGSLSHSGPIFLTQSNQEHPFQPGQADIFTVWLADMGEITSLDIGQSGVAVAGWSIIQVTCPCTHLYTYFYKHVYTCVHAWLCSRFHIATHG